MHQDKEFEGQTIAEDGTSCDGHEARIEEHGLLAAIVIGCLEVACFVVAAFVMLLIKKHVTKRR